MTSLLLWSLIAAQIAMGAFDTLFHHEFLERLAWRPSQRRELMLHGVRNLFYAVLFVTLGWSAPHGAFAWAVLALLAAELIITLTDFVEEDMTRKLPASERITHTLLALNYGAILVLLAPVLLAWAREETGIAHVYYGVWSILAALAAFGVVVFGMRDIAASLRAKRLTRAPAAELVSALPPNQTVLVTGATGFVGSRLVEALAAAGHNTIVLTRSPAKAASLRPPFRIVTELDQIPSAERIDAIVHLAGEPIGNGLWTAKKKRAVIDSRVALTKKLLALAARLAHRPEVFISASAIGWYGLRDDEMLTEASDSRPCFSHESCEICEQAAMKAEGLGMRSVRLRIGLVLGIEGGILGQLLMPFEFGMGGPIGQGTQWMSWIARDDLVRLIAHAIATPSLAGAVNATAPAPVRNGEFARALGRALHRPALIPLPAAPLKLLGGDFAKELLLGGQRVMPEKALAGGFRFRHAELSGALAAILGNERARTRPYSPQASQRLRLG
jgi:uncharacterized protein